MIKRFILETTKELEQTIYRIETPSAIDSDYYRIATSLDAFFFGNNSRNVTNKRQWTIHHLFEEKFYTEFRPLETLDLVSLHGFYDHIGYDYKKRKFKGEKFLKWNKERNRYE